MIALSHLSMTTKFHIVDNFYKEPDLYRSEALTADYTVVNSKNWETGFLKNNWPGVSTEPMPVPKDLDYKISKLLNKPVRSVNPGLYRRALAGDKPGLFCHIDNIPQHSVKKIYTGVVYLTLDEYCKGKHGTNFFRHKATGLEKVSNLIEYNTVWNDFQKSDAWELTDSIEMKYNRLLLIDGEYFHSPAECFGTDKYSAVYKQIFSFIEI